MKFIIEKDLCNGCLACFNVCRHNAIKLHIDLDGFTYPIIDETKCVDCGLCKRTCPITNEICKERVTVAYAVINKLDNVRAISSSGGVFFELARLIIDNGGVVFGAAFEKNLSVKHIYVDKIEKIPLLCGSKYVQSNIEYSYKKTRDFLEQGKLVLFSGTPCQIAGLNSFLKKKHDNLITQEVACHGVPSPVVWQKYLESIHNKSQIRNVSFRSKTTGWKQYSIVLEYKNGQTYSRKINDDSYMQAFLFNLSLRSSCYNCAYKGLDRPSDIMLGDFWGIDKIYPEMDDDKGTSLIFVNTEKGRMFFEQIKHKFVVKEADVNKATIYNLAITDSVLKPKKRNVFFRSIRKSKKFEKNVKKFTKINIFKRCFNKLKIIFGSKKL